MRALVYCRVSTDEQAEHGHSLAAQEQLCRERAAADDLVVEQVYVDDGYSAATLDRPALQQLLKEFRRGDTLYVYRLDRLSRDVEHMAALIRLFQKCGVTVRPLVGAADLTNSLGRAFVNIQAVFGQMEREQIGERASMGQRKRVTSGKPYWAYPYGFKHNPEQWEIDPDQAEVVRLIAQLRLQGNGFHTICRRLGELGHIPPRNRQHWHSHTIKQILSNPIYVGLVRYKGEIVGNGVPPILDQDTWHRLQTLNAARTDARTREATDYLLSGLVWCGCGYRMGPYRMHGKNPDGTRRRDPYYRCVGIAGRPSVGHTNCVSARKLDRQVLAHLDGLARGEGSPDLILPPPPRVDVAGRLAALDRELEAVEIALFQGRLTEERFDRHKERIEAARRETLAQADAHQDETRYRQRLTERFQTLAGDLVQRYETDGPISALKATVQQMVARIEVELPSGDRFERRWSKAVRIQLRGIDQ